MSAAHSDSVRVKLQRYFRDNPDEELTVAQAAQKFGVTETAVYNALKLLPTIEHVRVIRTKAKGMA